MSIYYHGTNKPAAELILKNGFKAGTYFTWDLHSALTMGGQWVFGIFFEDKDIKDYWEWMTPTPISTARISFLRKFTVECLYDNEAEQEKETFSWHKEYYGDVIHCAWCKGRGQLNKPYLYGGRRKEPCIVCNVCGGVGCINPDGSKLNEHSNN